MNKFETNKISKSEFVKLNEDDLMFITNPGRMGDEDGATFIIKHGNEFTIYRVDGWMYRKRGEKIEVNCTHRVPAPCELCVFYALKILKAN